MVRGIDELSRENGQGVTEYGVVLVVILLLVLGTVRMVGADAQHAFSRVVSTFQQHSHND